MEDPWHQFPQAPDERRSDQVPHKTELKNEQCIWRKDFRKQLPS